MWSPLIGSGVSISSAKAAVGYSPSTLGKPRTRVRRRPGMLTPCPTPGVPSVDGPPAAGRANITPPGLSKEPIAILITSMSHEATVPMGNMTPSRLSPDVVVPMRPYTAALGAAISSAAMRRVTPASIPVTSATASGVKAVSAETKDATASGSIQSEAAPKSGSDSTTRTWAMPASHSASLPGRISKCSSAKSAVRVRIGSTTTIRPPRLRSERNRPGKSAAVNIEPFETSGFAPNTKK